MRTGHVALGGARLLPGHLWLELWLELASRADMICPTHLDRRGSWQATKCDVMKADRCHRNEGRARSLA